MTKLPDPESLTLLVLTARRGSLGAAAEEAGTSQPAASKRMSALERMLGVRLLDRSRRGSRLTPTGELVTGWAERVLNELDVLMDGAQALRSQQSATLSVAASLTVAEHLLPAWLGELRRSAPDMYVGLEVTNSHRVCDLVQRSEVDLGFIESPGRLRGLRSRTVARDRLVVVVAPDHPWARQGSISAKALAGTPLISREPGSGSRDTLERAVSTRGYTLAAPLLELGSNTAVRSTALAGGGPAVLSEFVIAPDVATRTLVKVTVSDVDLGRALRVVWRTGSIPSDPAGLLLRLAVQTGAGSRS